MKKTVAAALVVLFAVPAFAATPLKTEEEKTVYAVGLALSRSLTAFQLSPEEMVLVKQGMWDGLTKQKAEVELEAYQPRIQQLVRERRKAQGEKLALAGK